MHGAPDEDVRRRQVVEQQRAAWRLTCTFLLERLHGPDVERAPEDENAARPPDMGLAAARAMRAALRLVGDLNEEPTHEGEPRKRARNE